MLNSKSLLDGLENYKKTLRKHLRDVQDEYALLDRRWLELCDNYEGTSASDFKETWAGVRQMFERYQDRANGILKTLEQRIVLLRAYDEGQ